MNNTFKVLTLCSSVALLLGTAQVAHAHAGFKDSTINLYVTKEGRFKSIITNQDFKITEWSKQYNSLYLEHNKLKLKNKFTKIGAGVIIGGLIYMTIAK